jgi:hypothetical protein
MSQRWRVGKLLNTRTTLEWSESDRKRGEFEESRRIFANFTAVDAGRSRELIAVCTTPEDARFIVKACNKIPDQIRAVLSKESKDA